MIKCLLGFHSWGDWHNKIELSKEVEYSHRYCQECWTEEKGLPIITEDARRIDDYVKNTGRTWVKENG